MRVIANDLKNDGIMGAEFPFLATDPRNHAVVLAQKKAETNHMRPERVWATVLVPGIGSQFSTGDRVLILSEKLNLFKGEVKLSNE